MTKKKIAVAIYSRVSSDRQREAKTIRSQVAENKKYAQRNSYRVYDASLSVSISPSVCVCVCVSLSQCLCVSLSV